MIGAMIHYVDGHVEFNFHPLMGSANREVGNWESIFIVRFDLTENNAGIKLGGEGRGRIDGMNPK